MFAEAGLDAKKINKILAEHQRKMRSALEEERSKSTKTFDALNTKLRSALANQTRALQQLDSKPLIITPITLWTARIFAEPIGMLRSSNAEPGNNWAKVFFFDKTDSSGDKMDSSGYVTDSSEVSVSFYFFWQNQTEYLAVLNANSGLVVQGDVSAQAFPDWLSGGHVDLKLYASLTLFIGGSDVSDEREIGHDVVADAWPAILGGSADSESLDFVGGVPYARWSPVNSWYSRSSSLQTLRFLEAPLLSISRKETSL